MIKGKLIIIGGAEDKGEADTTDKDIAPKDFLESGILARIIKESRSGKKSRVEIITTASGVPDLVGNDYVKAFRKLGVTSIGTLFIENREQAAEKAVVKRVQDCDILFFTGGDQLRLTSILGGTPFFDAMVHKLETDTKFIYAGSSAGAAAASESMIAKGKGAEAFLKGAVTTSTGFGLIRDVVFDTHFVHRGRIGRLFQLIATNPNILGIGLEENSGLLITNNNTKMEAIGPGLSILIDGQTIRDTNLLDIREGAPISVENITLHVMSKTDSFDIKNRKLEILTTEEFRR